MRTLIFGDVHGNLPALEKLFQIEKDVDAIICHGDVVNYGPWSNECVQLLKTKNNCTCLRGNHEDYFLKGAYGGTNSLVKSFFAFCYPRFNEGKSIDAYGESVNLEAYLIQHTLFNKYIFKDTEVPPLYSDCVIGHSHQQFERRIGSYNLFNTGSLGQNREFINVSDYIVYEGMNNKMVLKSFTHDVGQLINQMTQMDYPQACVDYYSSKRRL